jgi:N-acetylglucosamine kinase-like BadF-type ATPase
MSSILLAESGSTKTDWCFLKKGAKPVHFKTSGINPYLQTHEEISSVFEQELAWDPKKKIDGIVYYGAGAGHQVKKEELAFLLKQHFGIKKIEVQCDMMAAARAMCGNKKGIVSILGTGSNSCYYDGKKIKDKQVSLGYIAGDEGSGNYLGKRVLQYYAYKTFDTELKMAFEQLFGDDISAIINKLYKEPFPNRFLATLVTLLKQNRGHYMVENIIEDCLSDFFQHHILKYRESWKLPLYFTGSVAFEFKDVLATLCEQYELELGDTIKTPIDGLISYHKQSL